MAFNIRTLPQFERDFVILQKKYEFLKPETETILNIISKQPDIGTSLGFEFYKIRNTVTYKGIESGAKVIIYYTILKGVIYLITMYDKTDRDTITRVKLQEILKDLRMM